jgi:hypothetical protein
MVGLMPGVILYLPKENKAKQGENIKEKSG